MDAHSILFSPIVSAGIFIVGSVVLAKIWARKPKIVKVSEIWIYPIKSCKGVRLNSSRVATTGFLYDRQFMLVDVKGRFLCQRRFPRMALIETKIIVDDDVLEVNAPGMQPLQIPLSSTQTTNQLDVSVWDDKCKAIQVLTDDKNHWFCDFLETEGLKLVRMTEGFVRRTDPEFAPKGQASFTDAFPFHLTTQESLNELNSKLLKPITMERFRPNIVVSGSAPFAEDRWVDLEFKSSAETGSTVTKMKVLKPCDRCQIPDIDPETALPSATREPSRTMKTFRSGTAMGMSVSQWRRSLFFGLDIDHESQEGMTITVGDEIRILPGTSKFY